MGKEGSGNDYGWGSILAGIAGFFIIPFIPLFNFLALIFGLVAIVKKSKWLGIIGIVLGIVGLIIIYTFGGIFSLI